MPAVIFVCTANICRSPMAKALFQRFLDEQGYADNWRVDSAGTWALDGEPAALRAQQVMRKQGLDLGQHRSRSVSHELLQDFNLILVMERGHQEALQVEFPDLAERVFLLAAMIGRSDEIADPMGGSLADFEDTARELELIFKQGFDCINRLAGGAM